MSFETTQKLKECLDQLDTGKQDKITASGILKGNGSGGIAAADAAALKTLLDTLTSISPAADDKIPLTDISGAIAGYSTISNILALATGGAKIATGSYTGTGTFGQANPCSLTFDFAPMFFLAAPENSNDAGQYPFRVFSIKGMVNAMAHGMESNNLSWSATGVSWGTNSVSWYCEDAQRQCNWEGVHYRYLVLG